MSVGIYRERMSTRMVLVAAGCFAVGVSFLYLADYLDCYPHWKSVISSIGGLVIASVGVAVLWELFAKRPFVEEIFAAAKVAEEIQAAKILGITTEFYTGVEWTKYIDSSKEMDLMFFGGKTWRNAYIHNLEELVKRPGAKINLILPDPENSEVVEELARRFNSETAQVERDINDSEAFFKDLAARAPAKGILKVWYLSESPLFTFYRFDNAYVFAGYRHGKKGKVPTIVCHKGGSIADFIDEQLETMIGRKNNNIAKQAYPATRLSPDAIQADTATASLRGAESAGEPPQKGE